MLPSSLRSHIIFLLLLLVFTCLGGIAGSNIGSQSFYKKYGADFEHDYAAQDARWRMLPQPPERIKRLITARPYTVYAETETGKTIGCFKSSKFDVDCWFAVASIPPIPEQLEYPCGSGSSAQTEEITPERIKLVYCDASWREPATSAFAYVLKRDGSVWQWGHDLAGFADTPKLNHVVRDIQSLYLFVGWVVGAAIPLVLGIAMYAALRHSRKTA